MEKHEYTLRDILNNIIYYCAGMQPQPNPSERIVHIDSDLCMKIDDKKYKLNLPNPPIEAGFNIRHIYFNSSNRNTKDNLKHAYLIEYVENNNYGLIKVDGKTGEITCSGTCSKNVNDMFNAVFKTNNPFMKNNLNHIKNKNEIIDYIKEVLFSEMYDCCYKHVVERKKEEEKIRKKNEIEKLERDKISEIKTMALKVLRDLGKVKLHYVYEDDGTDTYSYCIYEGYGLTITTADMLGARTEGNSMYTTNGYDFTICFEGSTVFHRGDKFYYKKGMWEDVLKELYLKVDKFNKKKETDGKLAIILNKYVEYESIKKYLGVLNKYGFIVEEKVICHGGRSYKIIKNNEILANIEYYGSEIDVFEHCKMHEFSDSIILEYPPDKYNPNRYPNNKYFYIHYSGGVNHNIDESWLDEFSNCFEITLDLEMRQKRQKEKAAVELREKHQLEKAKKYIKTLKSM